MEINVPNRITLARLFVAIVLFAVLVAITYDVLPASPLWLCLAAGLFIVAAATDFLDGYFARKWKQVTGFGRVADPFVDKILVCGAFILMIPLTNLVPAWFVLLVVFRELGITALRAQLEGKGTAFGAGAWGKAKMLSQSILIPAVLVYEAFGEYLPDALWYVTAALVAVTLVLTFFSGAIYLKRASLDFS